MRFGIIGAMGVETAKLLEEFPKHCTSEGETDTVGALRMTVFTLTNKSSVVVTTCNVGQVNAAVAATVLATRYEVDAILFSGVAGGLAAHLPIGAIVVADDCINLDMNVKGLTLPHDPEYSFSRGEIPFMGGLREIRACPNLLAKVLDIVPDAVVGRLATGSEFLTTDRKAELAHLWEELGNPIAVDMEAAAVAQVAHLFSIPHLIVRAISDTIEGDAAADFNAFVNEAAEKVAHIVVDLVLQPPPEPSDPSDPSEPASSS